MQNTPWWVKWTFLLAAAVASGFLLRRDQFGEFGGFFAFMLTGVASYVAGPGPALLGPLIVLHIDRCLRLGSACVATPYTLQEVSNWLFFTLVMAAIGLAGKLTRKAIADLRQREESLQKQAQHKDRFLATLAHELRNPLAPLQSAVELLHFTADAHADPEMLKEVSQTLRRQVQHLVQLVDDLLDVHRIAAGKVRLQRETVELREIVQDAVATIRPQAIESNHDVRLNACNKPLWVHGDRTRMLQVLLNLLGNALKFTPGGGKIVIDLADDHHQAVITVCDTGIGIPPDSISLIFETFAQIDSHSASHRRGLGLGLSLSRQLVEMHDGTIEARSAGVGAGSQFIVRLPCQRR